MEMCSGSIENTKRLEQLYLKHHNWLLGAAFNFSKDEEVSQELVQDLYLYLGERVNPKIWYNDSFNILYCIQFIRSRFINGAKRGNKIVSRDGLDIRDEWDWIADKEYDDSEDIRVHQTYDMVLEEINQLKKTGDWVSAELFKLYWIDNPEDTLEQLSKRIGISNSTAFKHIKKFKEHIRSKIDSPFNKEKENE